MIEYCLIHIADIISGGKIILSLKELNEHLYVNATTGGGKTTLLLIFVKESTKFKMPVIFVDGKGSPDLIKKISEIAKEANCKFRYFTFSIIDGVASYDFLSCGNRDELRNKLMNMIASKENVYYYEGLVAFLTIMLNVLAKGIKQNIITRKLDVFLIYNYLMNNANLMHLVNEVGNDFEKSYFMQINDKSEKPHERLQNILTPLVYSFYSKYLSINNSKNIINLEQAIFNNEIILFILDVSSYPQDTENFGKTIIDDVNATFSSLARQNKIKSTLVIFDEFGSYASNSISTTLATYRSNGLHAIIGSQSLETIAVSGDKGKVIASSIISNTNTKIILRSLNQYDLELFSNISGTEKSYEYTHQMQNSQNNQVTGLGSMRIGNKYKVDIEKLRGLNPGYGYIYRVSNNKVENIKILY